MLPPLIPGHALLPSPQGVPTRVHGRRVLIIHRVPFVLSPDRDRSDPERRFARIRKPRSGRFPTLNGSLVETATGGRSVPGRFPGSPRRGFPGLPGSHRRRERGGDTHSAVPDRTDVRLFAPLRRCKSLLFHEWTHGHIDPPFSNLPSVCPSRGKSWKTAFMCPCVHGPCCDTNGHAGGSIGPIATDRHPVNPAPPPSASP